jgi:hypothetical protein
VSTGYAVEREVYAQIEGGGVEMVEGMRLKNIKCIEWRMIRCRLSRPKRVF